jgi:predicted Zn-dependent protease
VPRDATQDRPSVAGAEEAEVAFGNYANAALLAEFARLDEPSLEAAVAAVGLRLARASSRQSLPWRFGILNDRHANAFSLAGGYVYITTGLLDMLDDEHELAAVVGHEVAHICSHDQVEAWRRAERAERNFWIRTVLLGTLTVGVAAVVERYGKGVQARAETPQRFQLGSQIQSFGQTLKWMAPQWGSSVSARWVTSLMEGYAREDELKADDGALDLMTRAGYRGAAMVRVLEKLQYAEQQEISAGAHAFSHLAAARPGLKTRIAECQKRLAARGRR